MIDLSTLENLLQPHGLLVLGILEESADSQIVLIGNAGSSIWPLFAKSPENHDGLAHPMDRWSKRVGSSIASELEADVIFPFEGPPYPPVLNWTEQAGQAFPSPISMFIHRKFGLWHAHRFALLLKESLAGAIETEQGVSPCLSCVTQPCLQACPVNAFSGENYRVEECVDYLSDDAESNCRKQGCIARKACPVAVQNQYESAHARFHMSAFVKAQKNRLNI
jgi:hypothetical protein